MISTSKPGSARRASMQARTGSVVGLKLLTYTAYTATKGAVEALTGILAKELPEYCVR